MDPITVATGVLTVLTPFLVEGGKAAAKKAGEALWATLERRFKDNPAAETALVDLKAAPEDADNQAALRKEIRKLAEADAAFQAELERLLAAAEAEAPGSVHIEVRNGAVAVGNHATAVGARAVQIGGSVGGDVVTGNKTAASVFDQRGQQVQEQTNVAGNLIKK